jgi:glycosyltransferase involved in cell wall biosynthesis
VSAPTAHVLYADADTSHMNDEPSTLTIIALAWREANDLEPCFASVRPLVDSIGARTLLVLDHQADEATAAAAHRAAERVVTNRFEHFAGQRNFALSYADTEWVFFIDADERATPELCGEIARAITGRECGAWRVPRQNIFFGREVRHTGWWPDYQVRLFRRAGTRYDETRKVHELPTLDGETCTLLNPLVHYNYRSWGQFIEKQRGYAPLEAQALYAGGARARPRSLVGQPAREFWRRFVQYRGWKDGLLGLALSVAMSAYKFEVYRRLRALQRSSAP